MLYTDRNATVPKNYNPHIINFMVLIIYTHTHTYIYIYILQVMRDRLTPPMPTVSLKTDSWNSQLRS
jgi:hypothetical protein